MTVKLKPLGGKILVKVVDENKTTSGIIIPDTVDKEKPQKGVVIALGTGKVSDDGVKIPFNVKVDDVVFFKKYSPDDIKIDDEDYLIMDESDILGVVE